MSRDHFDRLIKVLDEIKDMDKEILKAVDNNDLTALSLTFDTGDHHLLRHLAINTALLVDMFETFSTEVLIKDLTGNKIGKE